MGMKVHLGHRVAKSFSALTWRTAMKISWEKPKIKIS